MCNSECAIASYGGTNSRLHNELAVLLRDDTPDFLKSASQRSDAGVLLQRCRCHDVERWRDEIDLTVT